MTGEPGNNEGFNIFKMLGFGKRAEVPHTEVTDTSKINGMLDNGFKFKAEPGDEPGKTNVKVTGKDGFEEKVSISNEEAAYAVGKQEENKLKGK